MTKSAREEESDKRARAVAELRPVNWDNRPAGITDEMRGFLESIKDAGTVIDSGNGDGFADLWVTVQGIEYIVTVKPSRQMLQASMEGK